MRIKTFGNVLVVTGAVVGIATVIAIATGYQIRLTPEMIQLLTYKALAAAAVGLIVAGSWIGRGGNEKHRDVSGSTKREIDASSDASVAPLSDGEAIEMKVRPSERQKSEH